MPRLVHEWAETQFMDTCQYRIVNTSSDTYVLESIDTDAMGTPCWKIVHSIGVDPLFKIIGPLLINKNLMIGQGDGARIHRYEEGLYEYTHEKDSMGLTVFRFRRSECPTVSYSLKWAEIYSRSLLYRGLSFSQGSWDSSGKKALTQMDSIHTSSFNKDSYGNISFLRLASIIDYLKGI